MDRRLEVVWTRIVQAYSMLKTGSRLGHLTLNMFVQAGSPHTEYACLSCSAAEARDLVEPLQLVVATLRPRDRDQNIWDGICRCLELAVRMRELLHTSPVPRAEEAREFADVVDEMCILYAYLSGISETRRWLTFNITIKLHQVWHLSRSYKTLNPRYHWCYVWENFAGRLGAVCRASLAGVSIVRVAPPVVEKWTRLLLLRWRRQ